MPTITGTLSIKGLESRLLPQKALLLMAGVDDPGQAVDQATDFIVKVRNLKSGARVAVTGTVDTWGEQTTIIMSDIHAAAPGTSGT